ncbi:unnamed protein product [Gordionus sp. m RMFG-2023]|uniref:uncharacterized protein LOC135922993 isoform X2 n=1 Tax=Gordionus sp. m RMFG-2023 TaxID=3053472 RepID=UPI0030E0B38D
MNSDEREDFHKEPMLNSEAIHENIKHITDPIPERSNHNSLNSLNSDASCYPDTKSNTIPEVKTRTFARYPISFNKFLNKQPSSLSLFGPSSEQPHYQKYPLLDNNDFKNECLNKLSIVDSNVTAWKTNQINEAPKYKDVRLDQNQKPRSVRHSFPSRYALPLPAYINKPVISSPDRCMIEEDSPSSYSNMDLSPEMDYSPVVVQNITRNGKVHRSRHKNDLMVSESPVSNKESETGDDETEIEEEESEEDESESYTMNQEGLGNDGEDNGLGDKVTNSLVSDSSPDSPISKYELNDSQPSILTREKLRLANFDDVLGDNKKIHNPLFRLWADLKIRLTPDFWVFRRASPIFRGSSPSLYHPNTLREKKRDKVPFKDHKFIRSFFPSPKTSQTPVSFVFPNTSQSLPVAAGRPQIINNGARRSVKSLKSSLKLSLFPQSQDSDSRGEYRRIKKISPPWYYSQNDMVTYQLQQLQKQHENSHPSGMERVSGPYHRFFHRKEHLWKVSRTYGPSDEIDRNLDGYQPEKRPRFFSSPPLLPDAFLANQIPNSGSFLPSSDIVKSAVQTTAINKLPRHHTTGHKHFKKVRKRLVNKSGSCNIIHSHIPKRKQHFLSDIFTTLLDSKWRWAVIIFTLGFLLSWTLYAIVWWLLCFSHGDFDHARDPDWKPCVKNAHSFTSLFLFSVETQHTIGYGHRYITEECPEAILVLIVQAITGAMIQGFVTGLIFSKLSRPKKRAVTLMFSRNAVICTRDGALCLLVRIGDMRRSHIVDAHTRAYLFRKKVTLEGETLPLNPYNLELGFDSGVGPVPDIVYKSSSTFNNTGIPDLSHNFTSTHNSNTAINDKIFLAWPCILVHRMDSPSSPFYDLSAEDVRKEKYEIVVILEGMIESTGMSMQARTSYLPSEILWGYRFQKLITFIREDGDYMVDYSRFHNTIPVNMPRCSARMLKELRDKFQQKRKLEKLLSQRRISCPVTSTCNCHLLHVKNEFNLLNGEHFSKKFDSASNNSECFNCNGKVSLMVTLEAYDKLNTLLNDVKQTLHQIKGF